MELTGKAYFVREPYYLSELMTPHLIVRERPYEIVATVTLAKIDYENFITDMAADRQFLEDNAALCSKSGPVVRCLRVTCRGADGSVLVVPDQAWADIAALEPETAAK